MARRPKPIHQLTAADFERMFPDEDACCAYLVGHRWPKGVKCPRCGADVSELKGNPWHWQCYNCAPRPPIAFLISLARSLRIPTSRCGSGSKSFT